MKRHPLDPAPFLLATGNPDKVREIVEIFGSRFDCALGAAALDGHDGETVGFLVAAPDDLDASLARISAPTRAPDVEETGATLLDNARIKVRAVANALGVPAIAEDTGLEVDALGGAPGVHSARYAGDRATGILTGTANCTKLLAEMHERLRASRSARFVTVAIWWDPHSGSEIVTTGKIEGVIVGAPRGEGGFGYDPVFAPAGGRGRTFAQMSSADKHAISHRGRAFRALAEQLRAEQER